MRMERKKKLRPLRKYAATRKLQTTRKKQSKHEMNFDSHYDSEFIIGIDEVGRGSFAGPVSVGAVLISTTQLFDLATCRLLVGLKDSKQLRREDREIWFSRIKRWQKEGILKFAIGHTKPAIVDSRGLTHSIQEAMKKCLRKLKANINTTTVLLDGRLKAPSEFSNQVSIIKGDEQEPAIALASIAAKVTRDTLMYTLAKKYPKYGFDTHVGYGTLFHVKAIKKYGITSEHRKSFIK